MSQVSHLDLLSIQFQTDRNLFRELSAACDKVVGQNVNTNTLKKMVTDAKIADIIRKYTNLSVSLTVYEGSPNAYVYPIVEVVNNPLVYSHWKQWIDKRDINSLIKFMKDKDQNMGYVDLKNAKVHGLFTTLGAPVYISSGACNVFTGEELAGIILHEVGHAFTFMQMISTMTLRNYALAAIADEIIGQATPQHRAALLKDVNDTLKAGKLTNAELKELEEATKAGEIHYAFMQADIENTRSETGCDFYDLIGAEYLADQFAARMGTSQALASGLKKMYDLYGMPEASSTAVRFLINFIQIVQVLLVTIFFAPLAILIALLIVLGGMNPQADIYDKPKDRIIRIRQQLVAELRLAKDIELKQKLIGEIKSIDLMLEKLTPFISLIDRLWLAIVPSFKKDMKAKKLQKEIEAIAYNDLFIHSAKLETLV